MVWSKRLKPHFIIIGGVKCASSSFYRYIVSHPSVLPCSVKETFFFSNRSLLKAILRLPRYLMLFPLKVSEKDVVLEWFKLDNDQRVEECEVVKKRELNKEYITGEATATYNHSANPRVIKMLFPRVKIIALVRNPTDRFISHHKMFVRFHNEGRKGYDVAEILNFVKSEISLFSQGKQTRLLHQGLYNEILSKWEHVFRENQFRIFKSEDLMNVDMANSILNMTTDFLNVKHHDFSKVVSEKFNVAPSSPTNLEVKGLLDEFYAPYNQLFFDNFGINID